MPPDSSACSMAGSKSDHTDAAIITPDAKPSSVFCSLLLSSFFINNTMDAPSVVPMKGIMIPNSVVLIITYPFCRNMHLMSPVFLRYCTIFCGNGNSAGEISDLIFSVLAVNGFR